MGRNFYNDNEEFREFCYAWAEHLKVTPNALFKFSRQYGRPSTWMKERYYGGVRATPSDSLWVKTHFMGAQVAEEQRNPPKSLTEQIQTYEKAVDRMCKLCVKISRCSGCPDDTCPLRAVSKMPLEND